MLNKIEELMKERTELKRVRENVKEAAAKADQANEFGYQGDYNIIINALTDKITEVSLRIQQAEVKVKGNNEDMISQFFEK